MKWNAQEEAESARDSYRVKGAVSWEVSSRLARKFSQEPTLDSMIEICEKRVEK